MTDLVESTTNGSVEMVIGIDDGMVYQRFKHPMQVVLYEPKNLLEICEALAKAAFEARDGIKPLGDTLKAELVERHRMILTQRIALMMNSMREDKKISNGKLAQEIADVMLREVF